MLLTGIVTSVGNNDSKGVGNSDSHDVKGGP